MPILFPRTDFATPEEEELYNATLSLGEAEYEVEVADATDFGKQFIDADTTTSVLYNNRNDNNQLRGLHIPSDAREDYQRNAEVSGTTESLEASLRNPKIVEAFKDTDVDAREALSAGSEEPTIFAFGMKGNTPFVQAHEYRHMAIDEFKRMPMPERGAKGKRVEALRTIKKHMPGKAVEEPWNRMYDMYKADPGNDQVNAWIGHLFSTEMKNSKYQGDLQKIGKPVMDQVEKDMKMWAERMSALDAASQTYEGVPPPKGTTWKEHYLKAYEKKHDAIVQFFKKDYSFFEK